jgi:hypothetical protein
MGVFKPASDLSGVALGLGGVNLARRLSIDCWLSIDTWLAIDWLGVRDLLGVSRGLTVCLLSVHGLSVDRLNVGLQVRLMMAVVVHEGGLGWKSTRV